MGQKNSFFFISNMALPLQSCYTERPKNEWPKIHNYKRKEMHFKIAEKKNIFLFDPLTPKFPYCTTSSHASSTNNSR